MENKVIFSDVWKGAKEYFNIKFARLLGFVSLTFLIALALSVGPAILIEYSSNLTFSIANGLILSVIELLWSWFFVVGAYGILLKDRRIKEIFSFFKKKFSDIVKTFVSVGGIVYAPLLIAVPAIIIIFLGVIYSLDVITLIGGILLVLTAIPAIVFMVIFGLKYGFSIFSFIEEGHSGTKALARSKEYTSGYLTKIFSYGLLFGLIFTGIIIALILVVVLVSVAMRTAPGLVIGIALILGLALCMAVFAFMVLFGACFQAALYKKISSLSPDLKDKEPKPITGFETKMVYVGIVLFVLVTIGSSIMESVDDYNERMKEESANFQNEESLGNQIQEDSDEVNGFPEEEILE